jgi:hypothetical protein
MSHFKSLTQMQVRLIHIRIQVSPTGLERILQAWAGVPMCSCPSHFSCVWFDHESHAQDEGMGFFEEEVAWRFSPSVSVDCVKLERFIFPVSHVTLGLANRLLKHTIDHADKLVKRTPQLLKDVPMNQMAAERKHEGSKQEPAD